MDIKCQRVYKHTYGVIQLAHKDRDLAPRGAYDEDYHYFTYEEQSNGDYIEYKNVVAKNGTKRTVLHEEINKEEYFKRKLAGTLNDDKIYCAGKELSITFMNGYLGFNKKKDV